MSQANVITLTGPEQRIARFLARERERINRASGVKNGRLGPQTDSATDLTGIGAELAFARLFNVYPDLTIDPRQGGSDCHYCGLAIDVKGTPRANGRLLAVPLKARDAVDLYALMTGEFPIYTFRGLATSAQLLDAARLTNLGHGPTYALPQTELHDYTPLNWRDVG